MRSILAALLLSLLITDDVLAINLTKGSKSDYQIIVRKDAPEPEKTAAAELRDHIERITQHVVIPVVTEDVADRKLHKILIGPSDRAKQLCADVKWEELGHDGVVIRVAGDALILAGGEPRGTLY